jgi:prepilin-type N-terminal cleavage/methylation domain-containing protein
MRNDKVVVNRRGGFTIVELLTVMAVIAILIGLLVPALHLVRESAKEIQQKAQFHGIGVGLELFNSEFGINPPSNDNLDLYDGGKSHPIDSTPYGGAQKLAEAMVGYDLLGFHPKSDFRSDGMNDYDNDGIDDEVYDALGGITGSAGTHSETGEENIQARTGPLVELENANAYTMQDIYGSNTGGFNALNYVLCDVFGKKRVSGNRTGMPILYYRARTQYTYQDYTTDTSPDEIADDIYYYPDNQNLLELGSADDATVLHPLADGGAVDNWEDFEDVILNKQILDKNIKRPYCAGSYILISAGPDGLYGNADDICNFTREEQ